MNIALNRSQPSALLIALVLILSLVPGRAAFGQSPAALKTGFAAGVMPKGGLALSELQAEHAAHKGLRLPTPTFKSRNPLLGPSGTG